MHKSLMLLLGFCLIQPAARAQFKPRVARYLDEVNIAKVLMAEDKIDSAILHYEIAVHHFDEVKWTWFDLGDLYVKQQLYPKAINAYSNAILNGAFAGANIHSEDFRKGFSDSGLQPFVQRLDSLFGVFYIQKYNFEFHNLISELYGADVAVRNMEDVFVGNDTTRLPAFVKMMSLVDTANNLPRLLEYLDNHPFPKASTLTSDVNTHFWLIVHHILQFDESNPNVAKLRKYIVDAVYNGEYDLKGYISTLDYQYIGKYRKQLFGSYKRKDKKGIYMPFPEIADLQSVDKRRAEWHLLSLYFEQKINKDYGILTGYDPKTQEK